MYNPLDLIPQTIDKNLRDIIITLILIQFTAFLILIGYLTYEFIWYKLYSRKDIVEGEADGEIKVEGNANAESDERIPGKLGEVKFDNEDEQDKIEAAEEAERNLQNSINNEEKDHLKLE